MTRIFSTLALFLILLAISAHGADPDFLPLSNGKNLDGWKIDTPGIWSVQNGMIIGKSPGLKHNDFLRTVEHYGDFVLKVSFRLVGGIGNSGIQLRSKDVPNSHEVSGYQADIGEIYWGCLYDESRRNRILMKPSSAALAAIRKDGWNDYVITARGDRITLDINGVRSLEWHETESGIARSGLIALQVHGGPPLEVQFKNIRIKKFD